MRMNASQFNEKKRVLLFLNTNTLLPTKKLYKGKGKSHTHRTRRVARPNRLDSYFRNYKQIIDFLGNKQLFVICNMGRCHTRNCSCEKTANFDLRHQRILFTAVEKGIKEILKERKNLIGFLTHLKLIKLLYKRILKRKINKVRNRDINEIYQRILGEDHIHPSNEGINTLADVVIEWFQERAIEGGNRINN